MILDYNKNDILPTAPICRSLLPFQRVQHFQSCQVLSTGTFLRLEALVSSHGELASMVKNLELRLEPTVSSIPRTRIVGLLATLSCLEKLTLLDNLAGKWALLSQADLTRCLIDHPLDFPNLKHLAFRVPSDWSEPFDPRQYAFLDHFPSLTSLAITQHGSEEPSFPPSLSTEEIPISLSRITSLTIVGGNTLDSASTGAFVGVLPNLKAFTTEKLGWETANYEKLLPSLPVTLESIHLDSRPTIFNREFEAAVVIPCDPHFPRFQKLKSLKLGARIYSDDLLSHLQQLPALETLTFGLGAFPDLEAFQIQSSLPPALKSLVLNLFATGGSIGWRIDGPFGEFHPDTRGTRSIIGPGWEVPPFYHVQDELDRNALQETVEVVRSYGIDVRGTAVDALKVREEWGIEMKNCRTAKAIGTGDFVNVKELYGEEWTKAAKAERRRRKKAWDLIKKEKAETRRKGKEERGMSKTGKGRRK